MENKVLIVTTLISALGLIFMPTNPRHESTKIESRDIRDAEKYLEELKSENENLAIHIKYSRDSIAKQKQRVKVIVKKQVLVDTIYINKDSIK